MGDYDLLICKSPTISFVPVTVEHNGYTLVSRAVQHVSAKSAAGLASYTSYAWPTGRSILCIRKEVFQDEDLLLQALM